MILITGATGFVGSYCLKELSGRYEVFQVNRRGTDDDRHVVADLTSGPALEKIRALDVDVLVHLASAIPGRSADYFNTNVIGTYNLLRNVKRSRLKKVILLSTLGIYRNMGDRDTIYREDIADFSDDEYGRSKLSQEMLVRTFCGDTTDFLIFRASSIYGPGNTSKTLLPIFYEKARNNEDLVIQVRGYEQNFINVRDVANIIKQGIESDASGVYNLFSSDTVTIEELARLVTSSLGSSSAIVRDYKSEQRHRRIYDRDRLVRDFDCESFTTLENGIKSLGRPPDG